MRHQKLNHRNANQRERVSMQQRYDEHLVVISQNRNALVPEIVVHETATSDDIKQTVLGEFACTLECLSIDHSQLALLAFVVGCAECVDKVLVHELLVDAVEIGLGDFGDEPSIEFDFEQVLFVKEVDFSVLIRSECYCYSITLFGQSE
jgi:hypothetical protein